MNTYYSLYFWFQIRAVIGTAFAASNDHVPAGSWLSLLLSLLCAREKFTQRSWIPTSMRSLILIVRNYLLSSFYVLGTVLSGKIQYWIVYHDVLALLGLIILLEVSSGTQKVKNSDSAHALTAQVAAAVPA